MSRVRLLSSMRPSSLVAEHCTSLLLNTNTEMHRSQVALRKKCATLLARARRRAFKRAYSRGMSAGVARIEAVLVELSSAYAVVVDGAKTDCRLLAESLAAQIVEQSIKEHPEILMSWLDRAISIVKDSHQIVLRYHPRLLPLIQHFERHCTTHLRLIADPALKNTDFRLECESGGVECSWREKISTLRL